MHSRFIAPTNPRTKIWRYMDFTKFLSLLEDSSLYFTRSDRFEDVYEGSTPHANAEMFESVYAGTEAIHNLKVWTDLMTWTRKWTYINCWHMNKGESYAMWKLYAQTGEAIAIQSTYERLRRNLPTEANVGIVLYKDYDIEVIDDCDTFERYLHKRESFVHEQELRVVVQDLPYDGHNFDQSEPEGPAGRSMQVDICDLIENVFVAPTAQPWFLELVRKILKRYGLLLKLHDSNLRKAPTF